MAWNSAPFTNNTNSSNADKWRCLEIHSFDDLKVAVRAFWLESTSSRLHQRVMASLVLQLAKMSVDIPPEINASRGEINFLQMLLIKCQTEFLKGTNMLEKSLEKLKQARHRQLLVSGDAIHSRLVPSTVDRDLHAVWKNHLRYIANVSFVGELFNLQMVSGIVIESILGDLVKAPNTLSLRTMCALVIAIGPSMHRSQCSVNLDKYFALIEKLIEQGEVDKDLADVLQYCNNWRLNDWVPL